MGGPHQRIWRGSLTWPLALGPEEFPSRRVQPPAGCRGRAGEYASKPSPEQSTGLSGTLEIASVSACIRCGQRQTRTRQPVRWRSPGPASNDPSLQRVSTCGSSLLRSYGGAWAVGRVGFWTMTGAIDGLSIARHCSQATFPTHDQLEYASRVTRSALGSTGALRPEKRLTAMSNVCQK